MNEIKPYCIVGFGPFEAYLVQATEANAVNARTGLKIDPDRLRLNYIDLEQEAGSELQRLRTQSDPRILADPNITVLQVQNIYPYLRVEDATTIETKLKLCRAIFEDHPNRFAERVYRYDQNRSLKDNELYEKILTELKSKVPYEPEPFNGIGSRTWIDMGGYVLCTIELLNLNAALLTLYTVWDSIKQDPKKDNVFVDVSVLKSIEQVRQWLKDAAQNHH